MPESLLSPLHTYHIKNKAKFIDFAGWSMPFSYDGTIKEHSYVRNNIGFFDVSHMGRIEINNSEIEKLSKLICSDIENLNTGRALYSIFTDSNGCAIDDVIFWKFDDLVVLICNAANSTKVINHLKENSISMNVITESTALIAVQGPNSLDVMSNVIEIPDEFSCIKNNLYTYARTGYTGEEGLEIMVSIENLPDLLNFLTESKVNPCGLGARDTLRLEASLPLYGFELSDTITPVEAGLKWTVTNKNKFIGSDIIYEQLNSGNHQILKKFTIDSRAIARTGTQVKAGNISGVVTSGNYSPILKKSIGFALFENQPSTDLLEFDIRGKLVEGKILMKRFLS